MRPSLVQKLLLLGAGLALSLLAAEGALRLVAFDVTQLSSGDPVWKWVVHDPILGWRNRPGFRHEGFRFNSKGFRGPELADEPGPLRVVCIGDSRTFGIWLDKARFRYDNDYPSRLQALIRTRSDAAAAEVINAGVMGYTTSNGLRQYITEILRLEPDVVVVGLGFNDHSVAFDPARRVEEPGSAGARRLLYALSSARLYRLLEAARLRLGFLHPKPFSVPWVTPERYAENIRRFSEVSREHGIRLLLLDQGLRPLERGESLPAFPTPGHSPYALLGADDLPGLHRLDGQYRAILRRTALRDGTPLLDVAAVFGRPDARNAFGAYDLVHFSAAGADLMAESVYERMRDLGWLDPTDASTGG